MHKKIIAILGILLIRTWLKLSCSIHLELELMELGCISLQTYLTAEQVTLLILPRMRPFLRPVLINHHCYCCRRTYRRGRGGGQRKGVCHIETDLVQRESASRCIGRTEGIKRPHHSSPSAICQHYPLRAIVWQENQICRKHIAPFSSLGGS